MIAKMRSNILDEKRPGSIIVDGGGKITYISTKSKEDEKRWMEIQLRNILMTDKSTEGRKILTHSKSHSKKYHRIWEDGRGRKKNYLRSVGQHTIPELFRTMKDPRNPDGPGITVPRATLYEEYIGPSVMKYFLPPISINEKDEQDNPEWLFEESIKKPLKGKNIICLGS